MSILDLTIDRYINGLVKIPLRLRMLRYTADPRRSLKGAYMMAEVEVKQMGGKRSMIVNYLEKPGIIPHAFD